MKNVLFLLLFFFMSSCGSSLIYSDLNFCVVDNYNKNSIVGYANINDSIKKYEQFLIKNKILGGRNKRAYKIFVKKPINEKVHIRMVKEFFPFYNNFNNTVTSRFYYYHCIESLLKKYPSNNDLKGLYKFRELAITKGVIENEDLVKLMKMIDFNDTNSRMFFLNLYFLSIKDFTLKKDKRSEQIIL